MKTNVLILGAIGTGKSYSLRTFLKANKDVFVLSVEPGIEASLGDVTCKQGLHWHYLAPAAMSWEVLENSAIKLNTLQMDALAKLPAHDKRDFDQFLQIYGICANFVCDRCGVEFGPIDGWDDSRVFALDGLTTLSRMAVQFVKGSKPITTLPETGAAQDLVRNLLKKLVGDTRCSFVLLAHTEREENMVSGGTIITVSTIGKRLAPDIPKDFDEVVMSYREGEKFFWSTNDTRVDLKARRLPFSDVLAPDFSQLFKDEKTDEKPKAKPRAA